MKTLKELKGVKTLSKQEQKQINGGVYACGSGYQCPTGWCCPTAYTTPGTFACQRCIDD
jgi:hypothetical protein